MRKVPRGLKDELEKIKMKTKVIGVVVKVLRAMA